MGEERVRPSTQLRTIHGSEGTRERDVEGMGSWIVWRPGRWWLSTRLDRSPRPPSKMRYWMKWRLPLRARSNAGGRDWANTTSRIVPCSAVPTNITGQFTANRHRDASRCPLQYCAPSLLTNHCDPCLFRLLPTGHVGSAGTNPPEPPSLIPRISLSSV